MAEKYGQIQEQTQQLKQNQSYSYQQLLQASLVELPVTQLVDRVNTEMNDNPALEIANPGDDDYQDHLDYPEREENSDASDDFMSQNEREERQSALDDALSGIGRDDEELPVYQGGASVAEEREEMVYGEATSFYDLLKEQMGELDMTERERDVMEYLIGSLDDDGLLRKGLDAISDELAIYHNIDVSTKEIEHVLLLLQHFDPAGIGARSLQECLLLQIERRDPQVLADTMEGIEGEFEIKADNYARVKASLEGTVEAIKTEEKRLAGRRKAIENNISNLIKNLQTAMIATGKTKFKTDFYSFGVQNNPPSVVVDADIEAIPEDYIKIKKEIDKTAIKDALKKGETFDFAHLEVTQGLRII